MMRLISVPILLAFLFASTHGIVDHDASGHKAYVFLSHHESLPTQHSSQHSQIHSPHHHDGVSLHLNPAHAHDENIHTHFTLAPFPRYGSTFLPRLFALTTLLWAFDNTSAQASFYHDDPFSRPPRFRPLYLHCCTLLI